MVRWLIAALSFAIFAACVGIYALYQLAAAVSLTTTPGTASFWAAFVAAFASLLTLAATKLCEIAIAAEARRREQREILTALCAEICSKIKRQRQAFAGAQRARVFRELAQFIEVEATLKAAETGLYRSSLTAKRSESSRFATVNPGNAVFDSLKQKLYTLPPQVVATAVVYYNLDAMLNAALAAAESSQFDEISAVRKCGVYAALYAFANEVDDAAEAAVRDQRAELISMGARPLSETSALALGPAWERFSPDEAREIKAIQPAEAAISGLP